MTPTTIFMTMVVTIVTVQAQMEGRVGTTTTLAGAGLRAEYTQLRMVHVENMDISQQELDAEKDERMITEPLVVNGMPSYPGMFQFQASLMINTSRGFYHICGAILLSNRHALTAAHCTPYMYGNVTFDHFLGVAIHNWTLGLLNPGSQVVKITHAENHANYGERHHDISMLYFDEDIVENKYVKFAELATPEMGDFERHLCVVSGWGVTAPENADIPDILQFTYQFITSKVDCQNFWAVAGNDVITDWLICGHDYPTSGCFGDSGGPLTCGKVVVGIVSWGLGSCSGCFPGVYTRVSKYTDWIARKKI